MKVVWSEKAKISLAIIYDYIFQSSPQNAEKDFFTLLDIASKLSDDRYNYSKDLIINKERYRFIPKWSYKIIYERTENEVIILDIFNTKQNPENLKDF